MSQGPPKAVYRRFLNRDRTFNVDSAHPLKAADLYHSLLSTSWVVFMGFVFTLYLIVNAFFGLMYYALGPAALQGVDAASESHRLLECFFFSIQTIVTIGYGRVSPASIAANALVSIEAFLGLLGLAVATGIFFARFSRPTARVQFSRVALLAARNGKPYLIFRVANERLNQIVEARVTLAMLKNELTAEGQSYRRIHDMRLERNQSPLFSLSWTLLHPIDESSPLQGATLDSLAAEEAELFVTLSGTDDTFSQTIHDRYSYTPQDLVWNVKFKDVLHRTSDGTLKLNLEDFHEVEPIA